MRTMMGRYIVAFNRYKTFGLMGRNIFSLHLPVCSILLWRLLFKMPAAVYVPTFVEGANKSSTCPSVAMQPSILISGNINFIPNSYVSIPVHCCDLSDANLPSWCQFSEWGNMRYWGNKERSYRWTTGSSRLWEL